MDLLNAFSMVNCVYVVRFGDVLFVGDCRDCRFGWDPGKGCGLGKLLGFAGESLVCVILGCDGINCDACDDCDDCEEWRFAARNWAARRRFSSILAIWSGESCEPVSGFGGNFGEHGPGRFGDGVSVGNPGLGLLPKLPDIVPLVSRQFLVKKTKCWSLTILLKITKL
jgi:hypothetical protein